MPRSSIAVNGPAVAERPAAGAPAGTPKQEQASADRRRPRLYLVDGIRLLAALLVVMHHFAGTKRADRPGNAIWDRPVQDIMPTVFRVASFGWIGVEIFFVISGFVICMSCWGRSPRQFFVSRVIRLYPAYWFAVLFTTGVVAALPGVWDRLPARDVLLNLTMLQTGSRVPHVDAVYWTLWSELRFYLLFLVVVAMGLTYRRVVAFCCVWGAAAMLAPVAELPLLTLIAQPDGAWYFIAGLALYLMHRFGQDLLLWGVLGMSWLMAQRELAERVVYEGVSSWRGALLIYTVFLLVMVAVALGRADRLQWAWLATAGCLTYPLYLLHYVAGTTVINRLRDTMDPRLLIAVVTAGFLLLSWLVHRCVERPVSRLMKQGLNASFTRLRQRA
ncbi:acyltransferase family protein [Streptomyces sp. NPDC053367]|uniref:acyltransferase family protein n=1 Tax=Streptomyces sp. NPDC053367 TaxID=3365700 RepID=UPI0037D534F9